MKLDLLDINRLISVNHLLEVESTHLFNNKMVYDQKGLLSTDIFGVGKDERRTTFAYISLSRHFIHPHLYDKVVKALNKNIVYLVSGQRKFTVRDGNLIEDQENGWTGLEELYRHWDEIKWDKHKSVNDTNKFVLSSLGKDEVFIEKLLVCPPAYRDVMLAGTVDTSDHVNECNNLYLALLRSISVLSEGGIFARAQFATQRKVQDILVDIYKYFRGQLAKKDGLIRKYLVGKSVDYGVRSVISSPTYNFNRIEDNMVDIEHVALPISQCCSAFYPFIEAWLKNFFTREIIQDPNIVTYYDVETNKEFTAKLKDPDIYFSEKNIKKIINDYCLNPDNRFRVIEVLVEVPTSGKKPKTVKAVMLLKGKKILPNNVMETLNRPMTVTDILYLASTDVCEKRHVMVSRYPVGTDKGIFFNNIRVQSTADHVRVIYNGKEYPYYPDINLNTEHDKVGVQFVDTLVLSNSHCDGMGADYDGDVLSIRGIWSDEANYEAEAIMNSKISALNITGKNSKVVAKEVFNTMYELTKVGTGRIVTKEETEMLFNTPYSEITRDFLTNIFADISDGTKKKKSKFNTWDHIIIPEDHFYKGQPKITSTVGRYIVNKFVLLGSGVIAETGYVDNILNKGGLGDLDDLIAQLYLEDRIDRKAFNAYTDRRDTIGYWCNGMLAHTISEKMLKPLPEVEKRKAELLKKYEKELASGDIDVITKVCKELVDYAKEVLKDDPGMDLYLSGDLDFDNNYKNNSIIKGAVMNKITGEFDFIGTSFMNGIQIKDLAAHANSILASQYPASVATQGAGYLSKKLIAILQMLKVDKPGTDCGSKRLIPITINKTNSSNLYYTYIDVDGQRVMLNRDNIKDFIGKSVMMRSPMSCKSDTICSVCAGKEFELLNIENAGLFGVQISHSDLNLGLKAKHDSTVNIFTLNPDNLIVDL